MRRASGLVALLLLTGCGLPLAHGVREPGPVPAEERQGGDVQVVPPGPRDDASSDEIVRDFFRAEGSPSDGHASAREFLSPQLRSRWRDTGPVRVLGPAGLQVATDEGAAGLVHVSGTEVAQIGSDGAYTPVDSALAFDVRLQRAARGRWVITDVPNGLVLSAADRERSFRARNVYFLAPPSSPGAAAAHLVPDRQFLPVTAADAPALVARLLAGPSRALGDSVGTAFPAGTLIRKVDTDASGLVTVDLSAAVGKASHVMQDQMSAQLVWTLRGTGSAFAHLKLLSEGKPLGADRSVVQDASDWSQYDPDGLPSKPPLYYVAGRRLRVLDPAGAGPPSPATSAQLVDVGAASPRGGSIAMVTRTRQGVELRTGPVVGPLTLRTRAASLSSPTWGSGEDGVWFLENGRVVLAPLSGPLVTVPVDGIDAFGPIKALRVSRDGARAALIAGADAQAQQLVVGRVSVRNGVRRIIGLHAVPGLTGVRDLSWDSATSLVVLGTAFNVAAPVRAAFDGSAVTLVVALGLPKSTDGLTAGPNLPLVVAGRDEAGVPGLFLNASGSVSFVRQRDIVGGAPFYQG